MLLRGSILAGAVALAAMCGPGAANAQSAFTLSSPNFKDGERLAVKYAGNNKANPTSARTFRRGPCTPPGAPHQYTFTLIATDLEPAALAAGMTREELIKALDGHAKGATGLVGTFSKP